MQARFVRGEDPRKSMDIGNDRKVRKGDRVEINYKNETYTVTALDDEFTVVENHDVGHGETEAYTIREFDFIDDDGLICFAQYVDWLYPAKWKVQEYCKRGEYDYEDVKLSESVNFERGQDPKKALGIGKHRKWDIGDKIPIYNAFEDDYWDGVVTNADYSEDPPWIQAKIYDSNLDREQYFTIHFNETWNEWMIDE